MKKPHRFFSNLYIVATGGAQMRDNSDCTEMVATCCLREERISLKRSSAYVQSPRRQVAFWTTSLTPDFTVILFGSDCHGQIAA